MDATIVRDGKRCHCAYCDCRHVTIVEGATCGYCRRGDHWTLGHKAPVGESGYRHPAARR